MNESRPPNSTFAIGGVSCSLGSFVETESFMLRINICGKNRYLRQGPNRYASFQKQQYKIKNMKKILLSVLMTIPFIGFGQNYTSYLTGNATDIVTNPFGGICLMGGATENDNAMKWFLQRANGGDILVLRTTGSNGYNSYLYSGLGVAVNSVETIVCHNALASSEPYIIQKIQKAEAIWFAGGDQWNYISYWRGTPLDSAINQAIQQRNIVIGGTSAGMAIQGKYYFSAQNGTVTSASALANPFNNQVTVDSTKFITNYFLNNTITDTHFDNPNRKGRLVTFLARIYTDYGVYAKAIACDEYTAVCIDTNGIARVFGDYPIYDDNAYFIQANCELPVMAPENCTPGNPLTWNLGGLALKAYQIKGDSTGSKTFNLNTWQTGTGGTWFNWSVSNGVFSEQVGNPINCTPLSQQNIFGDFTIKVFPIPSSGKITISINKNNYLENNVSFYNNLGQRINIATSFSGDAITADLSSLNNGLYFLKIEGKNGEKYNRIVIKN
jgi:cyanophycinase-like exopeptidase